MMASSCATCTTTRLILVNSSSRKVRGGSSMTTTASACAQRLPEVSAVAATSYRGGVVTNGSSSHHGGVVRAISTTSTNNKASDFSQLSLSAAKSFVPYAASMSSPSSSTKDASSSTTSGWSSSELLMSTLLALGISVSFLVGTASAPIEAPRSLPRAFTVKDPNRGGSGGGPQFNSNQSFMEPSFAGKEEGETKDVFAMGNRIPYDVSVSAQQGERENMEDEYFVTKGGRFAAVYDGHGGNGVSSTLRKRLFPVFNQHLKQIHEEEEADGDDNNRHPSIMSYVSAFNRAFAQVDNEIQSNESLCYQGSTAVAVAIHEGPNGFRTLVSGNVGDSRAILSRRGKAVDLTRDHKPNEEGEKARILGMGGTIQWDPYGKVHRVVNLSTSRAIGDRYARPMVSGQVEIKQYPFMEDSDEFILLASDGLWDVMTSQEVVDFVHEQLNNTEAESSCSNEERSKRALMQRRNMARYVANEGINRGSMDNVTVLMVWLNEI